jgi:membrane-anchored glycerophosphoryl diester phosphodiesterase (GDPDase)
LSTVSAATYAGIFFLLSLVWNVLWHLASDNFRLLGKEVSANQIAKVKRQYYVGPMLYAVAFFTSFLSGLVSVVLINSNSCFLRHNSNDW